MSDLPAILTLDEARKYLRLSSGSFAAIRPTLPVIVLGARRRGIRLSDLQAWLNAHLERAPSQDQR